MPVEANKKNMPSFFVQAASPAMNPANAIKTARFSR